MLYVHTYILLKKKELPNHGREGVDLRANFFPAAGRHLAEFDSAAKKLKYKIFWRRNIFRARGERGRRVEFM